MAIKITPNAITSETQVNILDFNITEDGLNLFTNSNCKPTIQTKSTFNIVNCTTIECTTIDCTTIDCTTIDCTTVKCYKNNNSTYDCSNDNC